MERSVDLADGSTAALCEAAMKDPMVRLLLELPRIREETTKMLNGVLDVLNQTPRDFNSHEIRKILASAEGGGVGKTWKEWIWNIVTQIMEYKGDWMKDTRGAIMMVASIISTVTFQAALSPPSGVWQVNNDCLKEPIGDPDNGPCRAGESVAAYHFPDTFAQFLLYDMMSFAGSVLAMFLLISGLPLSNKFGLWVLSLVMCLTITFLGVTFFKAIWLVIPDHILDQYQHFTHPIYYASAVVAGLVVLFLLIRLCYWLKNQKELKKLLSKDRLCGNA